MTTQLWAVLVAAFLASTVEFVEAFTIVLVVGVTVNWRSSVAGTLAAVVALAVIVGVLGTALVSVVPLSALRVAVGLLLALFGLKWLKKAILRYAGLKATHDEEAIYEEELAAMKARGEASHTGLDPFGVATSFKSVLLEGLEVAFIVITFGANANATKGAGGHISGTGIGIAAVGAAGALLLVVAAGALIRAPLQRVPENTLKFVVGIMLASFGTFWGGEGLNISWWHEDLFLPILIIFYLALSGALILWLRHYAPAQAPASQDTPTAQDVERPVEGEVLG